MMDAIFDGRNKMARNIIMKEIGYMEKRELENLKVEVMNKLNILKKNEGTWKEDKEIKRLIKEFREAQKPIKVKIDMTIPIQGEIELTGDDECEEGFFYPCFTTKGNIVEELYKMMEFDDRYDFDEKIFRKYFLEADNIRREREKRIKIINERMKKRIKELNVDIDDLYEYLDEY